ncbi:hypothetical protein [Hydrogenophaga sp.]|uniref:hypothetical protein n=1 Tax=Hydrogenophaga sp. TaxID=1904254 RepID=UPI0035B3D470
MNDKTLVRLFVFLLALVISSVTWAQTLAEKEKQWQSCEAAHYTGPREGRRNYTVDNYLWVVTPEFAKRYCMPESMVSDELKGAEAIAFRMVDGADMDRCGVDDQGKHHCTRQSMGRFEIYLPQSLNLPAANPDVRFHDSRRNTSEWLLSGNPERVSRSQRYIKGQYTPPPGTVPRFAKIYDMVDRGYWFGLWFVPKGSLPWPSSALFEVGFREAAVPGMNMLILENNLGMHFGFELNHYKGNRVEPGDPSGRYVIVMHKRDLETINRKDKRIPQDFEHVIYLPHAFAMQVREIAMKSGASNLNDFVNNFQQR